MQTILYKALMVNYVRVGTGRWRKKNPSACVRLNASRREAEEGGGAIRILSDQHLQSGLFPYQGHMSAVEEDGVGMRGGQGSVMALVWQEETEQLKLRHQPAGTQRGEFSAGWNNE